jgi:hypothetical protein
MRGLVGVAVVGVAGVALVLGSGAQASAQERGSRMGGHRAAEILQELGHSASVSEDSQGDPMVVFYVRGTKCTLLFYECEGRRCGSVQFRVGFATHGPDKPHQSRVNEWNRTKRFGKVYLDDERDPYLEYDVDFAGSEAREQLVAGVQRWEALIVAFRNFFL